MQMFDEISLSKQNSPRWDAAFLNELKVLSLLLSRFSEGKCLVLVVPVPGHCRLYPFFHDLCRMVSYFVVI